MAHSTSRRHSLDPDPGRPDLRQLRGMSVLLLIYIAIVVIAVIACAGPSVGTVAYRIVTDGGILLLWLGAAAGYGTILSRFVLSREIDAPPVLRFTTSAAMGLGAISLTILALGWLGLLNMLLTWGVIVAGLAAGAVAIARNDTEQNRARLAGWFFEPVGMRWLWLLTLPFVVAAIVAALVPAGLLWSPNEPHGYDVIEYHLQIPREWYEAGRIIPLHHNVFSFFPFNVEMHFLLAMHLRGGPWSGMYLAQFMHGTFVLLSVLAVYGLARWKSSRHNAILAAVALASVPWLARLAPIAYDEGGLLLFGTLAIGWALRATLDSENRMRRFIVAGLMAGFACGCKLTAVPEILLGVVIVASCTALVMSRMTGWQGQAPFPMDSLKVPSAEAAFARPRRGAWPGIAVFLFCGLLAFSPWLVRNAIWVRNPIFPEAANLLGRGYFSDEQVQRWHHAHSPQPDQQSVSGRLAALNQQIVTDWQFGYVFLPLVVLAIVLAVRRPGAWFLGGLFSVLLIVWLGFTHLQGRFFILALPVGALLLAEVNWEQGLPLRIGVFLLVGAQALAGGTRLWAELLGHLYGRVPIAALLGDEDLSWARPAEIDSIPASSPIILVGDAKAFWYYQVPMARLRYKTVFDVNAPAGANLIDAWAGPVSARDGGWLMIDPQELSRFARTYHPLPPLPPEVATRQNIFLQPPNH